MRHHVFSEPVTCVHHWMLEPADAAVDGIVGAGCNKCGATRTFSVRPRVDWTTSALPSSMRLSRMRFDPNAPLAEDSL